MTDANPTYTALLADVLAAPADDAPRLGAAAGRIGHHERLTGVMIRVEVR